MSIEKQTYGALPSGETVDLFTLKNKNGLSAQITNYGGIIVSLSVPDKKGDFTDIALGKDSLKGYLEGHPLFGAITGRVAGRISNATFSLEEKIYSLEANNLGNCLHGGLKGFDKLLWKASIIEDFGVQKLSLSIVDPDGSNGFPGEVECSVTYALLGDNTLEITYEATTTQTTPFNITNHAYFNLKGTGVGYITDHVVQIPSDSIADTEENATLNGKRIPVVAGYNDYRKPIQLSDRKTLELGNADNHYFLEGGRTKLPRLAAIVSEAKTGRVMEVLTTEPGVQFYAGTNLSDLGPEVGKNGVIHPPFTGLCFETQDYPDSVNFPEMGDAILHPGETFKSTTLFRFKTT